ncbi:RNA polymerase sigma factor [Niveibacterium sp. SC-1]|uniref:RNA polymerase sigma factor n=1 Tax=Niveibacterium sp. SC-1 TaxID=3135646 RepID=UPI00311D9C20
MASGVARHVELVNAARRGEPQALEHLLRAASPDIRRYARRHCLLSDVDDAVQESLIALTRHIRQLREVAAFAGWLARIVQRECRRLTRLVLRHESHDEATLAAWLAHSEDEALRIDLGTALAALPEHYREIVLLRDFAECSIEEIATQLGLSLAATKSRLHRARSLTRGFLLAGSGSPATG